jgi:hypothetical protein
VFVLSGLVLVGSFLCSPTRLSQRSCNIAANSYRSLSSNYVTRRHLCVFFLLEQLFCL